MTEPTLFPLEPIPVTLTERQAFVLAELRRHEDGLAADEVGAMLHARRDKHDAGVRCQWCSSEGQSVLRALRKKGLVRRKRGGLWLALGAGEPQVGADADSEPGFDADAHASSPAPSASDASGDGDIPY